MGLSFSKDKNIDIYLNTDKQYYISGETVNGEIYLNAKITRTYLRLVVRLVWRRVCIMDLGFRRKLEIRV